MTMYRYETHIHTWPVSRCGKTDVQTSLKYYRDLGFTGVFITNHFIDKNRPFAEGWSYEERIRYYFSDYEKGKELEKELGLQVFCGVEISCKGTDFLIYGLDKQWYVDHPGLDTLTMRQTLTLMGEAGALIIQAHPFREANYIDHIRLFPRQIHGVEVYNGCRSDFENKLALQYADNYGLLHFAGTDNHKCGLTDFEGTKNIAAGPQKHFGGMESDTPVENEQDFIARVLNGQMHPFRMELDTLCPSRI